MRGLALWFILIDHAGNNPLQHFTLGRFALCDAAEVFVLLSGISAGLVYGSLLECAGWRTAARAILLRAGVIYLAYVGIFLLFGLLVWAVDAVTGSTGTLLHTMRLDTFVEHPVLGPVEAFLMRFTPYTMDVLPLYVALLAALAAFLPLIRRPALLLGLSAMVYFVSLRFDLNISTWDGEGWGFDPLEWQALFLIGVVAGNRARSGRGAWATPVWVVAASIGFLLATRSLQLVQMKPALADSMALFASIARALQPFFPVPDVKVWLHPLRLVSVLSLALVFRAFVPRDIAWLETKLASPFVLMGQHSLIVFCAGIPVSFVTGVVLERSNGLWVLTAVNVVGFAITLGVAAISARVQQLRKKDRSVGVLTPAYSG